MITNNPKDIFIQSEQTNDLVFVIHGLTGAPIEMKYPAKILQQQGFSSYIPLLKGHGEDTDCLIKTSWPDWYNSLEKQLKEAYEKYGKMHILGLCAGGTLGLMLAAKNPHMVKSIVIYSPIINYDGWNMKFHYTLAKPLLDITSKMLPFLDKINIKETHPFGIKNDRIREFITKSPAATEGILEEYPLVTLKYYLRLVKKVIKMLPTMKTPLLLIQSIDDDVSNYKNASLFIQKNYGGVCDVHLLNNSYHLINIDQQKESVARYTALFFKMNNKL